MNASPPSAPFPGPNTLPPPAPLLPAHLLAGARLLTNREQMLELLPKNAVFAEVGVGLGGFSDAVIKVCKPSLFVAIDEFRLHELDVLWGQSPKALLQDRTHGDAYRARFAALIAAGHMRVIEADSADGIAQLDDASIDILYLDADHRYDYVWRDLQAARPKLRDNGWIIANDYLMVAELGAAIPYGVVNAANEFMLEHEWGIQYFALQAQMFCDVALRPVRCIEDPQTRIDLLQLENERLRQDIEAIKTSTSWRASAPLRRLSRTLRKLTAPKP